MYLKNSALQTPHESVCRMLKQMTPHKNLMFRNLITDYFTHVFKRGKTDKAGAIEVAPILVIHQ